MLETGSTHLLMTGKSAFASPCADVVSVITLHDPLSLKPLDGGGRVDAGGIS